MHEAYNPNEAEKNPQWQIDTLKAEKTVLEERNERLEKENDRLFELAYKDPLTGLWNRNGLQMLLEKRFAQNDLEFNQNRRNKKDEDISLLVLDIDHFKSYNDEFGHDVGDEVLAAVGKALKEKLKRETDIVARWGGEELVVVFEGHDEQSVLQLFSEQSEKERAQGIIGRPRFNVHVEVDGHFLTVTLSGAVTTFKPNEEPYPVAFKRTDETLYKAKGRGEPTGQGRDRILGTNQQKEKDAREFKL